MGLTKATLTPEGLPPGESTPIEVLFNPSELSIDQSVAYAEHPVLGSADPIIQFVRLEGRTLNVELFLDRTSTNSSVEDDLKGLRRFVEIHEHTHAPPVCTFRYGDVEIKGVVKSLGEKYVLFNQDGRVVRARVTMSLRRLEDANKRKDKSSPDRTRVRVLHEGETLAHIAQEAYGDARLWPVIATANGIERPRFVAPGTPLKVPSI
jgi:hypothetical protein